jgi:hypothetical protein
MPQLIEASAVRSIIAASTFGTHLFGRHAEIGRIEFLQDDIVISWLIG